MLYIRNFKDPLVSHPTPGWSPSASLNRKPAPGVRRGNCRHLGSQRARRKTYRLRLSAGNTLRAPDLLSPRGMDLENYFS